MENLYDPLNKGISPCKISEVGDLLLNVFPLTVRVPLVQVVLLSQRRNALLGKKKKLFRERFIEKKRKKDRQMSVLGR